MSIQIQNSVQSSTHVSILNTFKFSRNFKASVQDSTLNTNLNTLYKPQIFSATLKTPNQPQYSLPTQNSIWMLELNINLKTHYKLNNDQKMLSLKSYSYPNVHNSLFYL